MLFHHVFTHLFTSQAKTSKKALSLPFTDQTTAQKTRRSPSSPQYLKKKKKYLKNRGFDKVGELFWPTGQIV
jgi:hypothetical protein